MGCEEAPNPWEAANGREVSVNFSRIMSYIFHFIRTLYSTRTNTTHRCHKATALAKDVTLNLLGRETYDCISKFNQVCTIACTKFNSEKAPNPWELANGREVSKKSIQIRKKKH